MDVNTAIREVASDYVRGLLMGGADIIPGVSGGTVALIVGIYERLIASIKEAFAAVISLLKGDLDGLRSHLAAVEWALVIPVLTGIVTALLLGAAILPGLLERYPIEMRAAFFGLIVGSLYIPWHRMGAVGWRNVVMAAVAAVVAFLLVGLPAADPSDPSLIAVFFMASVAICAMILPGVSGAFLLLVFGIYEPTLSAIHDRDLLYIGTFVAGAAVGIGSFSGLLNWLLERYHDATMSVLIGLMAGSLRALWPWITVNRELLLPRPEEPVGLPISLMLGGAILVLGLYHFAGGRR